MKGPGLLWMLQTGAGLSMAVPMFVIGVELLRSAQFVLGTAFLTFGVIALYLPTYLINQIGGPRAWIRRRLGRADRQRSSGDTDASSDENGDRSDESTRPTLFERFRNR